jgi:hypothetical protein
MNISKYCNNYLNERNDPILIEIYKELGDEFDYIKYSKTLIKKIPKKYEKYYYITEYDGLEEVNIDYAKYEADYLKIRIENIKSILENIKSILENDTIDNDEKINQLKLIIEF